ncbi:erythromycin esterase family protein [Kitasatospora sp. NPDC059646]|uniref:erythromycin esterase family protein n=1 Tax=Kitasatospora sp. NPDC059646 TaxID=3346893 RepID=UPI00367E5F05
MTAHRRPISRRGLLTGTAALALPALHLPAAAAADRTDRQERPVVQQLTAAAYPLDATGPVGGTADLRPLGELIGDSLVVGLGEATHGSHEFFTLKHRVFRYLVTERGFTAFALEASWTAGLEIDEFLQGGDGDARRVADRAFAGSPWHREEFADLIGWMRDHNRRNPGRPVHFLGADLGLPALGDRVFRKVLDAVRAARPQDEARIADLYAPLRPLDDAIGYLGRPLPERRANAELARRALASVSAVDDDRAVQDARVIADTFEFLSMDPGDPASVSAAEQLRDRAMAQNVLWWQRRTGHRILLSAHNGHAGYASTMPELYPDPQGAQLRRALGGRYTAIGTTFDRGSFLTTSEGAGGAWQPVSVPPAAPGSVEHTLDQVRHRDFYLPLRRLPAAARGWLATPHPTYDAGTTFTPEPLPVLAPAAAYDVLVHLHEVTAARELTP